MTTYVLIPGFWLGGWAWREVAADLRGRGHEVHALSLTGMGERAHLARPDTDLETHITDVLNLVRYAELEDVVLVGHSYAGAAVVHSVADRIPSLVRRLVFVDSGPLPNGMSQSEFGPPDEQEGNASLVRTEGDGWKLPPPPWAQLAADRPGITGAALERLNALSAPQPWKTATSPVRVSEEWKKVPRTHILCSFGVADLRAMAASVPAFEHMRDDDLDLRELPGWHWPMLDQAPELAELLHSVET